MTFCIILESLLDKFVLQIYNGIRDFAETEGISLITVGTKAGLETDPDPRFLNIIETVLNSDMADGFILFGGCLPLEGKQSTEVLQLVEKIRKRPLATISTHVKNISSLLVNNTDGIRQAMIHLIDDHGCRKIAFLKGTIFSREAEERYNSYLSVLQEKQITFDPELVYQGDFSETAGEAAYYELKNRNIHYDAVLASCDTEAIGFLKTAALFGKYAPDDFLIIGFDNIPEAAETIPPLTSISQPYRLQGRQAVEILSSIIRKRSRHINTVLPTKLVKRQSCGCLSPLVTEIEENREKRCEQFDYKSYNDIVDEIYKLLSDGFGYCVLRKNEIDKLAISYMEEVLKPGNQFFDDLNRCLRKFIKRQGILEKWLDVLTLLNQYSTDVLGDPQNAAASTLLFQSQTLLFKYIKNRNAGEFIQRQEQREDIIHFLTSIINAGNRNELFKLIDSNLGNIGITGYLITLEPTGYMRFHYQGELRDNNLDEKNKLRKMLLTVSENQKAYFFPFTWKKLSLGNIFFTMDRKIYPAILDSIRNHISTKLYEFGDER